MPGPGVVPAGGREVSRGRRKHPGSKQGDARPDSHAKAQAAPSRRRLAPVAGIVLLAAAIITILWRMFRFALPGLPGAASLPPPREKPPESRVAQADFVGAQRCVTCHAAEYAKWKASVHGRAGGPASPGVVIAAFDGRPIRFRDAVVTPRMRDGAYEFVVAPAADTAEVFRVDGVIGRGHMEGGGTQGFVTKRPDGTIRFLPFDWSRHGRTWFCNTSQRADRGWVPISDRMNLADCGDWPPARVLGDASRWANCQSCHASQLRITQTDTGRTTAYASLSINCESCHGPARRHVELAENGSLSKGEDVGLVSLRTLDKDGSLRVCYQCHAVKDRLRDGYASGDSLELFYSLKYPALGDRPLHPDGRVRSFAYQEAHQFSDCYLNGGMTCTSCHDPHSQGYRTVTEEAIPGRFDDRQCTSCHASKADRVAQHTHHAATSPGSRCTSCHMPYLQEPETVDPTTGRAPIRYARSDHSIAIPRPRADSALGVATACASCHANRSIRQLDDQVHAWWGGLKPVAWQVAMQSAPWIPDTTNPPRHAAAVFAGLARFVEGIAAPDSVALTRDVRRRLGALSRSTDVDIRALALASLHLAAGNDPSMRRDLARAAAREGPHDFALRSRWAVALGYMGDRYAEGGNFALARVAYERALEVQPDNARLLESLGNAERSAGDYPAAIRSYERALGHDPAAVLTMVNLGIALGEAGDTARAIEVLRRAATIDPWEPLAPFNLGNIHLSRGELDQADSLYLRTLALDPGIAVAHFRLARVWILARKYPEALRELRRGLAFDSTDAAARETAGELAKALGRTGR